MAHVILATPAKAGSRKGNRITAERWARHLESGGHVVEIADDDTGGKCDALIALHARRSAGAIRSFRERHPNGPVVLLLTGTDLHRDIHVDADAQASLEAATQIVGLHHLAAQELPQHLRPRTRTIVQSAVPPDPRPPRPRGSEVRVTVLGHLRPEKDPFRAAEAVRNLPQSSTIRVTQLGQALSPEMRERAAAESTSNPRYAWLGERSHRESLEALCTSDLHVLSSEMEGGANVICEALACGVPTLASKIPGSIGLLGEDYAGYFPFRDTDALRDLLSRSETDAAFYAELVQQTRSLSSMVSPERERDDVLKLMRDVLA